MFSNQSDHIFLQQLTLMARIGILDHERLAPQPICLDIELGLDLSISAKSGRLKDTLDYAHLVQKLSEFTMSEHIDLIETLAEGLVNQCFTDKRVSWVKLRVGKPQAIDKAQSVGVVIYRTRADMLCVACHL